MAVITFALTNLNDIEMRTTIISTVLLLILAPASLAEWSKHPSGSLAWFKTIAFSDAQTGFIGGSKGIFLRTDDGGETWKPQRKFTSDTIRKIYFTDDRNGWALCERDIYRLGSDDPSYLMRTENGGKTWTKIEFDEADRRRITSLVFSKRGFGLAMGEMGTMYALKNDRVTWEKIAPPTRFLMLDGAFASEFRGALVGGGGTILFTEDAGVTWSKAAVSKPVRSMLNSVYFVDRNYGWTVGAEGSIYQTVNGGKYWRLQNTFSNPDLNGVYFKDSANGWAVGDGGVILRTTTGGNVWVEDRSRSRNNLEDIQFFYGKGWIVGFGGTLLKYETGIRNRPKHQR